MQLYRSSLAAYPQHQPRRGDVTLAGANRPRERREERNSSSAQKKTPCCHGVERRARDSNPQPLTGHFISNEAASHSLTLLSSAAAVN